MSVSFLEATSFAALKGTLRHTVQYLAQMRFVSPKILSKGTGPLASFHASTHQTEYSAAMSHMLNPPTSCCAASKRLFEGASRAALKNEPPSDLLCRAAGPGSWQWDTQSAFLRRGFQSGTRGFGGEECCLYLGIAFCIL